jgi:CheY-like chemotaxis protein
MPHTLLLADDSVTIQRVIELTFAGEDIHVVAVGDGDSAIARLAGPPPDIVLADVDMPGRDGYAVADHVRTTPALAHVPVLLLTSAFAPVDDARVRACGCAGVLVKPFEPQMVIARVRELLGRAGAGSSSAGPASAGSPAPATPGSAPAWPPAPAASTVDEYFEQLDAAFANLNVPLEPSERVQAQRPAASPPPRAQTVPPTPKAQPVPSPVAPAPAERATDATPVAAPPDAQHGSPPSQPASQPSFTIADAFGALLGLERGEPVPPIQPPAWTPSIDPVMVEEVARRASEEMADRLVREIAPEIVSRIAERLVREEIERLKALQQ